MTHNHQLDFDILESVLKRGDDRYVGLIGSTTKWERFKHRFLHKGYDDIFFKQVRCPIGAASVPGKLPIEVAVSVATEVIGVSHEKQAGKSVRMGISWNELRKIISDEKISETISGVANIKDDPLPDK